MKIKSLLFYISLLALLPASARTERCERRFRVAVNAYQPFYAVDKFGQLSGLTYDLIKEIEARFGCIFMQQPADVPRMLEDFKNWRSDVIALIDVDEKASQSGTFVKLFTVHRQLIVGKTNFVRGKKIKDYLNNTKLTFINQIGNHPYITSEELARLRKQGRVIDVPVPGLAYQMVYEDRAQFLFTSPAVNNYYLKQNKFAERIIAFSDPDFKIPVGLFISEKRMNADESSKIVTAVESMRKDGTIRKILLKYIEQEDLSAYEDID